MARKNINHPATQNEQLVAILTRIQGMQTEWYILMTEHWDWLVVLQCLQDRQLFRQNPQRMPLTEFETWIRQNNVPQQLAKCTKRTMSYANDAIHGARYPWTEIGWNKHVLKRWQILYRTLDSMLQNMTNVPK